MLVCAGCGRIGYNPIGLQDDGSTPQDDGSTTPDEDAAVDPDLLVWIPFDDDPRSGAVDQQGVLAPGQCAVGRCPLSEPGIMGRSYRFDGTDDYVQFATVNALDFGAQNQPFTVSLWYLASDVSPPLQQVLMAQATASGGVAYQLALENFQGLAPLDTIWKVCESDCQSGTFAIDTDKTVQGAWTFVVGTWDGSTSRLFVDAVEVGSAPKSTIAFDGNPLMVGADLEAGDVIEDSLDGAIDDLRIYTRTLSIADQMQLMDEAKNP